MSLPFRGRWAELNTLVQAFDAAERGDSRVVLVEGEEAIGTSALLQEFGRTARRLHRRLRVVSVRAGDAAQAGYDPVACAAEQLMRGTLEYRLRAHRVSGDTRELMITWAEALLPPLQYARTVAMTVQRLRRRQTGELPKDPDVRRVLRAAQRMTLVLMDDLHLMTAEAAAHLELLIRGLPPRYRLLLVAGMRSLLPGEAARPVDAMLATLPHGAVQRLRLAGLAEAELRDVLSADFAGAAVPADLAPRLLAATGGHPRLVSALIEDSRAAGALDPDSGRWDIIDTQADADEAADLPALAALRPATVEMLTAASLFGTDFDGTSLALLLERDELEVEDHLAVATRHGVVTFAGTRELRDGELSTLYRFESLPLRAALYRSMPQSERRTLELRLHALAAADPIT